jgi:single-strand DNA-binding protein
MNDAFLTISGNVATDIRYAETDTGVALASFRMASTPRRFDRGERRWVDLETMYFSVTCWRFLADNVRDSVRRGDPVVVTGRLRQRSWQKDDRSGVNLELTAEAVGHDLGRGVSRFAKVTRTRVVPPDEQDAVRAELGLDGPVDLETGELLESAPGDRGPGDPGPAGPGPGSEEPAGDRHAA